jgi:hypothetical protein
MTNIERMEKQKEKAGHGRDFIEERGVEGECGDAARSADATGNGKFESGEYASACAYFTVSGGHSD